MYFKIIVINKNKFHISFRDTLSKKIVFYPPITINF